MFCTANFYAARVLPDASLKSIHFYQNKPKSKLILKEKNFFECLGLRPPNTALSPQQISGCAPDTRRVLLILPIFGILKWEVIELAK